MRTFLLAAACIMMSVACSDAEPVEKLATSTSSTTPSVVETTDGVTTVASLGLTFRLPPTFVAGKDPELVYLARRAAPRAVFSIARDTPAVVRYEPVAGESVTQVQLPAGVRAVVVTGKDLAGLPPGVTANELLVANGERSFTVIFSAGRDDLDSLWTEFLQTVRVQPA
jgi:hypothetical protein